MIGENPTVQRTGSSIPLDSSHQRQRLSESIYSSPISPLTIQSENASRDLPREIVTDSLPGTPTRASRGSISYIPAEWLPYTQRWYFIWVPIALSFSLGLTIVMLYWYSRRNQGLSPEMSALFGWKFVPTLIAVIYTQLTVMLFDDVKRTEPFARLARPAATIPGASRTILERPREWFITLAHGFNRSRNGGQRSWIVIFACAVNVFAFLGISPLSAALLGIDEVNRSRPFEMTRYVPKSSSPLSAVIERDTFFRTMASLIQNVTTSPWVTDDFFVLPFAPSEMDNRLLWNPRSSTAQTWEAETLVFRNDLQCSRLELAKTDFVPYLGPKNSSSPDNFTSVLLQSDTGCQYNLTIDTLKILAKADNFSSWADINHLAVDNELDGSLLKYYSPSYNDKCQGDEAIIMSTPWVKDRTSGILPNLTISGYLCASVHTMATLPVQVSVSLSESSVEFGKQMFSRDRQPVPESLFNSSQLHDIYVTPEWWSYVPSPKAFDGGMYSSPFAGSAALLGTQFGFNVSDMMNDASLPEKAGRIRRRFFGEVMRSSFGASDAIDSAPTDGKLEQVQRRVTVSVEAACILSTLFFASFIMLLLVAWLSQISQRHLHLTHDPSTVLGTASLVASDRSMLSTLRGLDQSSKRTLKAALEERVYATSAGTIYEVRKESQRPLRAMTTKESSSGQKDWKPSILKFRMLSGLAFYLILLIIAIAVLFTFANKSSLYHVLFTYKTDLDLLGRLGSFAPFSIIPTFLAITLGLWWDGLDKSTRALQPFVSMSKGPTTMKRGAGVSYQSTYWLWATGKSVANKDWLLALITLGTFLAQVFIIAMSALFEQGAGTLYSSVDVARTLEMRHMPHIQQVDAIYPPKIDTSGYGVSYVSTSLQELYSNLSSNWMYSAILQMSLNGPEPLWSKDDWSFIPVELSEILNTKQPQSNAKYSTQNISVTIRTPAVRGKVECSVLDEIQNTTLLYDERDTKNLPLTFSQNRSLIYIPKPSTMASTNLSTPFTTQGGQLHCCFNQTDPSQIKTDSMPVTIGYWTSNHVMAPGITSITGTTGNFTVKWVHGKAGFANGLREGPALFFPEAPKIQGLNCKPGVEVAQAEVTIDPRSGRVQHYSILEKPQPEPAAWSESFILRNLTTPLAKLPDPEDLATVTQNLTTSYGVLFLHSLLRAASLNSLSRTLTTSHGINDDDFQNDKVFNIRDNQTGINMDFMSYASYLRTKSNPNVLLDADALQINTQKTFSLFFKHFVGSAMTPQSGGWAYQKIGADLKDVGPAAPSTLKQLLPGGQPASDISDLPPQNTERMTTARVSTRVEVLRMNRVAFWVATCILIWLLLTICVVTALQRWYLGDMIRNVESIADVLVLIARSPVLLAMVRDRGVDALMNDGNVYTRLGWFKDVDGNMRWGIEVVEGNDIMVETRGAVGGGDEAQKPLPLSPPPPPPPPLDPRPLSSLAPNVMITPIRR